MKRLIFITVMIFAAIAANGQRYITKTGYTGFYSHTPLEDIKADNNQVASVLDTSNGELVFQVLMKSFHFEKALMEEHFNENYVESDKYPRSTFTGKISNLAAIDFKTKGTYDVTVEGDLMIHGTTKKISATGSIEIVENGINANSKFIVRPEDYGIVIPGIVRDNIARELEITVTMKYTPVETN